MKNKTGAYFKYAIGEIVLVVIGILIALQINNWNENRKNELIETKILSEISNGLKQDLVDIKINIKGHESGLKAVDYWKKIVENKKVNNDSLLFNYHILTRDFLSVQNTSGYESLKSKGLEYIDNDSIRIEIITIYEQDYTFLKKLEEDYQEMQFYKNYFNDINTLISPYLSFAENGYPNKIEYPINLSIVKKKMLLSYLWKIKSNRLFTLKQYHKTEGNVSSLIKLIDSEIDN